MSRGWRTASLELQRRPAVGTVPGVENEALAAILAALERQGAALETLAGAVAEMSSTRAHGDASGDQDAHTAPAGPPQAVLSELVDCTDPATYYARVQAGKAAGLPSRLLDLFAENGGRGLYRDRDGHALLLERGMDFRRVVVRDAQAEDPKEAASMGADLLKSWGAEDPPA